MVKFLKWHKLPKFTQEEISTCNCQISTNIIEFVVSTLDKENPQPELLCRQILPNIYGGKISMWYKHFEKTEMEEMLLGSFCKGFAHIWGSATSAKSFCFQVCLSVFLKSGYDFLICQANKTIGTKEIHCHNQEQKEEGSSPTNEVWVAYLK